MKRFIAILMLFVYSLSISGMALQLHFCDDNIQSVKLANIESGNCCCSEKTTQQHKNKSCCGETGVVLKLNIDQSNQYQLTQFKITGLYPDNFVLFNHNNDLFISNLNETALKYIDTDVGKIKIPLYKLFKQIVYYS